MTTFLDLVRKATLKRRENFIQKGGPGSGWFAPPKGTHIARKRPTPFSDAIDNAKMQNKLADRLKRMEKIIPAEHLKGLKVIFYEALEIGKGSYRKGKLVLHPKKATGTTVAHELGHHVYEKIASDKLKAYGYQAWERAMHLPKETLRRARLDPERTPQGKVEFFPDVYTIAIFARLNSDRGIWDSFAEIPEFKPFAIQMEKELFNNNLLGK